MRSDLFILLYLAMPLLAEHALLEFREISTIKLIVDHEKLQISTSDVLSDLQVLLSDVESFSCTANDCDKARSFLIEALKQKNETLRSIFSDTQVPTRKKRSWDPIGKGLKWMGGVMDADDREILSRKVNILYENQKTLYDQLESLLTKPEALKAENAAQFNQVEKDLKHVQELIGLQRLNEKFERISAQIDGIWRTFLNKRIDGIFITSDALEKLKQVPQVEIADCIKNADAEVEMENSKFIISMRVPTVSEQQLKLYEITATPSDLESHILLLKLPQKFFGFDEVNKKLISLNENNLISCRKSSDESVMFCNARDIIQNVNTDGCLEKAFRDKKIDSDLCASSMELWQSSGFGVVEFGKEDFWVHTRSRKDMTVFCGKNDREIKTFSRSEIFHLAFGCHAIFSADGIDLTSYVTSDESSRLKSISANISKADFVNVIESMAVSRYLENGFLINAQNYQPKGLSLMREELEVEAKYQATNADELKVIKAQHNEALVVVAVIAVALMLFMALKQGKPYILRFLPPSQPKEVDEEQNVHESEEKELNSGKKM